MPMSVCEVEEFKYVRVLFMSEGTVKCEINRVIGTLSAVLQTLTLYWSGVQRERSNLIYVLALVVQEALGLLDIRINGNGSLLMYN